MHHEKEQVRSNFDLYPPNGVPALLPCFVVNPIPPNYVVLVSENQHC